MGAVTVLLQVLLIEKRDMVLDAKETKFFISQ